MSSDSNNSTKIIGTIASILGILAFFGISNYDELVGNDPPPPSDVTDEGEGENGTITDPDLPSESEPEPDVPIDYAMVGGCIDRDRGIVVRCDDGTADYQVAARYQNPGGDPGLACANAGYPSTPMSPAYNYVVDNGTVLLCIYEI